MAKNVLIFEPRDRNCPFLARGNGGTNAVIPNNNAMYYGNANPDGSETAEVFCRVYSSLERGDMRCPQYLVQNEHVRGNAH
jgi:hypothetical protein